VPRQHALTGALGATNCAAALALIYWATARFPSQKQHRIKRVTVPVGIWNLKKQLPPVDLLIFESFFVLIGI
jgi:hypothetical protein